MSVNKTTKIQIADILLIIIFLLVILYFFANLFLKNNKTSKKLIVESGKNIWYYQLDKNRELKIQGILGDSIIKIEDGKVFFENSPCPNKLCVLSNPISKNGDWVACLPNGVFARIQGEDSQDSQIDSLSY